MSFQLAPSSLVENKWPSRVSTQPWLAVTKLISCAGRASGPDCAPISAGVSGATLTRLGEPFRGTLTVIHLESTTADGPTGRPSITLSGFQVTPPSSVANN